ncbi:uncharacterized protein PAC_07284 [Phialocephala subalpina]|uniref:Protein SQS1 n=1 Tax=Phialocephala subalpina TaxID=576137 RepID=A0A1L7WXA3_9HELO|nr:uncharacterized protein PAC_07284 [Phialocephala subalpina]
MPRTKRPPRRGNHQQGAGRGGRQNLETSFVPFAGTSTPRRGEHGFTLQEEARNTGRHQSFWNTDQRLRDTKVSFVSAGALEPTMPKDPEAALAEMTLDSPEEDDKIEVFEEEDEVEAIDQTIISSQQPVQPLLNSPPKKDTFSYIVDVHGSEPVQTGIRPPQLRSVSPAPSDSSEEIILFRGRDRDGKGISLTHLPSRTVTDPIEQKIRRVEDEIHKREEWLQEVLRHDATSPVATPPTSGETSAAGKEAIPLKHHNRKTRRGRRSQKNTEDSEEAALIADYIANIDKDDDVSESFTHRELGGTEDELWQDTEISSGEAAQKSKRPALGGWGRSEICDFDDLSTSDGVMGDVQQILSKRDRASGVQYLVVWEEQTIDEARWVPSTTLTSVNALSHIETFEAEGKLVAEFISNEEEDTTDSDELDNDEDADDDEDDEQDLVQRKIDRMSDEKIARLLAKQEELGMGSSGLILFDDDDGDEDDIPTFSNTFSPAMPSSNKSPGRGRGAKRPRGDFPSATMLADAYDGFDVMDFERPSLKKKPKGRRGKLAVDISDSELEASMEMAWKNDRMKKKERKQEREELRAQGLLGSKNGKPDLKQKYKEGMGILAVKEEIKQFLMSTNTTYVSSPHPDYISNFHRLSLPPMDKADRKVVHELANAFNLKSKSAGTGTKRFPVLYRTLRTSVFAEHKFNAVEARITRRFLPRMDVGGKRSGGNRSARGGGGFNNAAVSYRDGDIVGGSAPELGVENRGRAMLEKMGWSSGTALGALNNKGILQPVSHVVKTTKAGLG